MGRCSSATVWVPCWFSRFFPLRGFGEVVDVEPAFIRLRSNTDDALTYHSLYCAFHTAFQPSGTLGGGGPGGGASAMMLEELCR